MTGQSGLVIIELERKMPNKLLKRKENVILIVITILLLGFVLFDNQNFTGYISLDKFETQIISYGTSPPAFGGGNALAPNNNSYQDKSVNFIFNVTAGGVHNASGISDYCIANYWFEKNNSDISGNSNDGTWSGADGDENVTGIIGYAFKFDGIDDYISLGTDSSLDFASGKGFTVTAWIKTADNNGTILSFRDSVDGDPVLNLHIGFNGPATKAGHLLPLMRYDDGTGLAYFTTTTNIVNNIWYFIAFVYDPTAQKIYAYVNDSSWNVAQTKTGSITTDYKNIGVERKWVDTGYTSASSNYFNGTIDELMIFNRTLSSGEISYIYNQSLRGEPRNINNCSLLLNIDSNGYQINITNTTGIIEGVNYTFNVNFSHTQRNIDWKIQCYNDLHIPQNTSEMQFSNPVVVQSRFPVDSTITEELQINFTYNVSADNIIHNCSIYLDIDNAGFNNNITLHKYYEPDLINPINQSDGFSIAAIGSSNPYGMTTNGSDFWIVDLTDQFVYHTNKSGYNFSDGFSAKSLGGSIAPQGVTNNGSDFWVIGASDDRWVFHTNKSGYNFSDGFSARAAGSTNSRGITTNGSDFWFTDIDTDFVYHVNASGDNQSDGFSTFAIGSESSNGITTNGSDFWFTDTADNFVYHTNKSGYNFSDGFSTTQIGIDVPMGIATDSFVTVENARLTPTNFWIIDNGDKFVYHIKPAIKEDINQTITINFGGAHAINWKVGCYDNNSLQRNSSVRSLIITSEEIPPADTGSAPSTVTPEEPTPPPAPPPPSAPPPAPTPEQKQDEISNEVGDLNLDPGFQGILKDLLDIDLDLEPQLTVMDITNQTLQIVIGNETKIDIDYTGKKPTILIQGLSEGTRPPLPIIWTKLFSILLIILFLIISYYLFQKYKPKKIKLGDKKYLTTELTDTLEINNNILRFNNLLGLIKQNILKNNLNLASKHYEELLQIYNFLILKLNKQEQEDLYQNAKDMHTLLKNTIIINFYKKKLK